MLQFNWHLAPTLSLISLLPKTLFSSSYMIMFIVALFCVGFVKKPIIIFKMHDQVLERLVLVGECLFMWGRCMVCWCINILCLNNYGEDTYLNQWSLQGEILQPHTWRCNRPSPNIDVKFLTTTKDLKGCKFLYPCSNVHCLLVHVSYTCL